MRAGIAMTLCLAIGCAPRPDPSRLVGDAAVDVDGSIAVDGSTACGRHPPARPSTGVGELPGDVVFGLRDIVLNQTTDAARMTGYDLDGRCLQDSECMRSGPHADEIEGVDNQLGVALYPIFEAIVPGLESLLRATEMAGTGLVVLRLRGWNGMSSDPQVDVTLATSTFSSVGTDTTTPPDIVLVDPTHATLVGGAPLPPPAWDGHDWTWVRDDDFVAGDLTQPLVRDDNAYVEAMTLVARLPDRVDLVLPSSGAALLVRLTDGVVTGRISTDGTMLEDVLIAGRWSVVDLVSAAENLGLCPGSGAYEVFGSQALRAADLSSRPGSGGPGVACDAVSSVLGFTGHRVRIATPTQSPAITSPCP